MNERTLKKEHRQRRTNKRHISMLNNWSEIPVDTRKKIIAMQNRQAELDRSKAMLEKHIEAMYQDAELVRVEDFLA